MGYDPVRSVVCIRGFVDSCRVFDVSGRQWADVDEFPFAAECSPYILIDKDVSVCHEVVHVRAEVLDEGLAVWIEGIWRPDQHDRAGFSAACRGIYGGIEADAVAHRDHVLGLDIVGFQPFQGEFHLNLG